MNITYTKNYYKGYLKTHLKSLDKNKNIDKRYLNLGILNPCIGTSNLGDKIIYESVCSTLKSIFPEDFFTEFPTRFYSSYDVKNAMAQKDLLFVSGTNLLTSNLETQNQWKLDKGHQFFLENNVVLFGCGWWQYQEKVNKYTSKIYKSILHKSILHSVRDKYSELKLREAGIQNVVNTTCPTLWNINADKCRKISKKKSQNVITTLTSYHKSLQDDSRMLDVLSKNYEKVFLWIQGYDDAIYLDEINREYDNLILVPPTLNAYDKILETYEVDYVGTRLHAGVRAIQKEVRTIILAVDNRAVEIGRDTNLNVIKRTDKKGMLRFIKDDYITAINLPIDNINKWKESLKEIVK